jgi:hypothetical protein
MNTEERDFQIEDNVDFSEIGDNSDDLTPDVTDFDSDGPEGVEGPEGSFDGTELPNAEETSDISDVQNHYETDPQKETPSSNNRVMRYEDFVKNL